MQQSVKVNFIKDEIRNIPDFPTKGIQFKDITTVIKNPLYFNFIINELADNYKDRGITKVIGIESRGFITGGALAYKLNAGFIPVRKKGKLPAPTFSTTYTLEYGEDTLEIHQDALKKDDIVLIHDDLLATGGTCLAVTKLVQQFHINQIYLSFIIELDFLKGRERFSPSYEIISLINF